VVNNFASFKTCPMAQTNAQALNSVKCMSQTGIKTKSNLLTQDTQSFLAILFTSKWEKHSWKQKICISMNIKIYRSNSVLTGNICKTCVQNNHIHSLLNSTQHTSVHPLISQWEWHDIHQKTGTFKTPQKIQTVTTNRLLRTFR